MKRIFATLMLAALALSSCVKENDSYKDWLPVQPGQYIYTYVMTQDRVAMQAANAGMRVAVMAAEVAKQRAAGEDEVTIGTVKYNNQLLLSALFNSGTKIEETDDGYMLTFLKDYLMPDGFHLGGSLLVRTGGAAELANGAEWSVEMQPDFKLYSDSAYGSVQSQVNMYGGTTTLKDNQDGSYTIRLTGIAAAVDGSDVGSSYWSTSDEGFVLRPEDEKVTLAYSSCHGETFLINGSASGLSIYANMSESRPLSMSYTVTDGLFVGMRIIGGTQECEFTSTSDYDTAVYPAPDVRVEWTNGQSRIFYNGNVYPKE